MTNLLTLTTKTGLTADEVQHLVDIFTGGTRGHHMFQDLSNEMRATYWQYYEDIAHYVELLPATEYVEVTMFVPVELVNAQPAKRVEYDRDSREYAAYYGDHYLGNHRSHSDAETVIDRYVYETLSRGAACI